MYKYSILLQSGSLDVISVDIIKEVIVVVACFVRCVFTPDSDITSMLLLGGLGGISIQFIKLILALLI